MFDLPLHPLVVHLPIALSVLLPLVSLVVLALFWRDGLSRKSFLLVPLLSGLLFAGGLAAAQTGEEDEEIVEKVAPEASIEAHEEAAELFNVGAGVLFALSMVAFAFGHEPTRKTLAVATTVGSFVVLGLGVNVGHAGGELVYRHDAASAHTKKTAPASTGGGYAASGREYDYAEEDDD